MYNGRFIFTQLMQLFPRNEFNKCVRRYDGNKNVRLFSCWQQFQCLIFGHLTQRESLRDIVTCLNAHQGNLYHLGLPRRLSRSTFSDANRAREWRIFADYAGFLINEAKQLYSADPQFILNLDQPVYALDGSIIELCLSLFPWAKMHTYTAAMRLHVLLDAATDLPSNVSLTSTSVHELEILRKLELEPAAIYVMDRGYLDWEQLNRIKESNAFFVIRCRTNTSFEKRSSMSIDKMENIIYDYMGRTGAFYAKKSYPGKIRCIKVKGKKSGCNHKAVDKYFRSRLNCNCRNIQEKVASRTVLQMDQTALKTEGFLGKK